MQFWAQIIIILFESRDVLYVLSTNMATSSSLHMVGKIHLIIADIRY